MIEAQGDGGCRAAVAAAAAAAATPAAAEVRRGRQGENAFQGVVSRCFHHISATFSRGPRWRKGRWNDHSLSIPYDEKPNPNFINVR